MAACALLACKDAPPTATGKTDGCGQGCGEHARCDRAHGAEHCACQSGFSGDGHECVDIDECQTDNGGCDPLRECSNTAGSFSCGLCPDGYSLDAANSCKDIDECSNGSCDRVAPCSNRAGSFSCGTCPEGYWGSGLGNGGCVAKAIHVAAGAYHTCALLAGGDIRCWGSNLSGELGQGDTRARGRDYSDLGDALLSVPLPPGSMPLAITAGVAHTCVVLMDGSARCWGANDSGQLGQGDSEARGDGPMELGGNLLPIQLGTGALVARVAAGSAHSCALLGDGSVKCWGANEHGQLGLGDVRPRGDGPGEMGDALPAVSLGAGRSATAISAGGTNSCALLDDGTVKCWGNNEFGQLGLGDQQARGGTEASLPATLPAIDLGSGRRAIAIATSDAGHSCALLDDHALKCWGANSYGQLGLGDSQERGSAPEQMGDRLPAVELGNGHHAVAIALGGGQSCALLEDGSAKCWGYNEYASLGLEDFENRGDQASEMGDDLPAISLGSGLHVLELAPSRSNHSCALLDNGAIKCWGSNGMGQLGHGDVQSRGGTPGEMGDNLPAVNLGHQAQP